MISIYLAGSDAWIQFMVITQSKGTGIANSTFLRFYAIHKQRKDL